MGVPTSASQLKSRFCRLPGDSMRANEMPLNVHGPSQSSDHITTAAAHLGSADISIAAEVALLPLARGQHARQPLRSRLLLNNLLPLDETCPAHPAQLSTFAALDKCMGHVRCSMTRQPCSTTTSLQVSSAAANSTELTQPGDMHAGACKIV